jgi:peroxiredoxin Q/BCP
MAVSIGEQAPDFDLHNEAGERRTPRSYEGKWLILYFYPKDDTPGCTREAIDFSAMLENFTSQGAIIAGVSADSPGSHQKFIAKHNLQIELLADPDRRALEAYGVWKEKNLYGRKSMGVVRTTVLIDPGGVVRAVWDKVTVDKHAQAVMDTLCTLKP